MGFRPSRPLKRRFRLARYKEEYALQILVLSILDIETKVKCFEYGMDYYITKPIKVESIYYIILSVYPNV
jgi:DNA-binding response OmpR family regulator